MQLVVTRGGSQAHAFSKVSCMQKRQGCRSLSLCLVCAWSAALCCAVPCKVRGAASLTAEREARALAALEKGSAERAAALAAREKLLQEREDKVRRKRRRSVEGCQDGTEESVLLDADCIHVRTLMSCMCMHVRRCVTPPCR